jgi:hypothetical protein
MIYTAVLVACLTITPERSGCQTHEMLVMGGANPMSAFVEAQTRASQWLAERPGLQQFSLTIHAGRGV